MRYARNGIGGRGSPQGESPNQGGAFASAVLETQTYGGPQFPRQQGRKHMKRNWFTPLGNRRSAGPDVPRMNSSRRTSLGRPIAYVLSTSGSLQRGYRSFLENLQIFVS